MKLIFIYLSIFIINDKEIINQTLDNLHKYASEADGEKYLALLITKLFFTVQMQKKGGILMNLSIH